MSIVGPKDFPIRGIDVIGGFNMVAFYDKQGDFKHAACSCGWQWNGLEDAMFEAASFHNSTHGNIVKVRNIYETRKISYDCAMNFLQIVADMNEGRAAELISSWQIQC